uniref:RNA-directed DNA polymerase, eukaryota, reverse transcriptase zinc-binding domain protein n=1 Tax=Tanacetum cinerariifolium TaxID=118510 RepID=A0A6L2JCM8_TANCI|nr:RNA-directed DNA polymerase, eukaryota, reverse transcriptase zinc-binding domain protein [Tanacetum cinerariifolium]
MVLDDSCLNEKDYSLCLMGKVKDFSTLANLEVVVANEGFDNIKFKYMGGYWVMMEFQTEVTKLKFQENSVMKTWFSQIQLASSDFNTDERVTWVKIEGIPLKMWSKNTFNHVALKWVVLLDVDDQEDEHFHMKRICINTNVPTNIFESFKLIYRGKVFWVRAKEVPGWISDFVEDNDEEEDSEVGSYEEVPKGEDVKNVEDLEGDSDGEIVLDTKFEEDFLNQKGEEDSVGQGNVQSKDPFNIYELLNHKRQVIDNNSNLKESLKYPSGYTPTGSQKSEVPKSGGFILQLIDDLVKVGETMGASVGNSSGILCVWDPNMFKNTNSTVSDYFVMDYLSLVMSKWEGEVVIMGDFNEVRNKSERFGTLFNRHGADVFNRFISNAGLEEVPLEGCSFTWCHRSATKMSKLDRFLISDSLLCSCPNICSITLDRHLSDHRPILMREVYYGYGPVPRTEVVNLLQEMEKKNSLEAAQKAKIKWVIEGDENSKCYHGVINKKRNQLSIRGILVEGTWIGSPSLVKSEFPSQFKNRLEQPNSNRLHMNMHFSNTLSSVQVADLECQVSKEDTKKAVWDCGIDKSPGPDGFTFGFYRRYWKLIENDVVDAVTCFFHQGSFPKGGNSSFIILIPKTANANMVKDYMPISLIGSMHKIISKILANRLVVFNGVRRKRNNRWIFKVDFKNAYDWVRWDHLDDIMRKFGFGEKWCMWIQRCLRSSRGSVNMNGSPTEEFQFYKGLKQGDPLSPFLFILVMESLHILFQRVVDVGLFKGIELAPSLNLSHTFYADDAIFMGQWRSKEGGCMSRIQSWNETIERMACRLSKWKLKTLSIGDLVSLIYSKLGNEANTSFWEVAWRRRSPFKSLFPRLYALETQKKIDVASKLSHSGLDVSFRRPPRGGVEIHQFEHMKEKVEGCILADMMDKWFLALEGLGEFTITSVRRMIDDFMLPEVSSKTRWIKAVPIKVNVHAWKDKLDGLPTRLNISRRGIDIESILCLMCGKAVESTSHIFFTCQMSKEIL